MPLLKSRTGPSIVYVTLQKHAEDVANELLARGLSDVLVYHAGLPAPQRQEVQVINCFSVLKLNSYHATAAGNFHEIC